MLEICAAFIFPLSRCKLTGVINMESIWKKNIGLPQFPPLREDRKTDVLIIGGGLTGLLCAYRLSREGVDYILVEQDRIMGGTSGNTTAKITAQHGLCYHRLLRRFGVELTRCYYDANMAALTEYHRLCQTIHCDYAEQVSYIYSRNRPEKLHRELYALDRIGIRATLTKNLPLPFPVAGAIPFPHQAQFHPLKFAEGISRALNIYENTPVRGYDGTAFLTDTGRITAKTAIVATHFPIFNKHGLYFLKQYQHRSYILALSNAPNLQGMYMDEKQSGLSFRNQGDLLLLGGGAHRTGRKGGGWTELETFAREHYPESGILARWAAQDCMPLDDLPYIGPYSPRTPNLLVATGYQKWGITTAMVASQLLGDLILGKENDFASLFSPSRTILRPQLAANTFHAALNLLTPTRPRCPHMGCALKWNPLERSWDCPCHGSRFNETGRLLESPATGNLNS